MNTIVTIISPMTIVNIFAIITNCCYHCYYYMNKKRFLDSGKAEEGRDFALQYYSTMIDL